MIGTILRWVGKAAVAALVTKAFRSASRVARRRIMKR
jgi:hypothetical protein